MAAPTVTGVAPTSGTLGGGTVITVTGTGFYNGGAASAVTGVTVGGTAATGINVMSDTNLTCITPAHAAGTGDVIVTTPGGSSATSSADKFTFTPTLAQQFPGQAGGIITYQAANALGDTFVGDGFTVIRVKNADAGAHTATIKGKVPCSQGFLHDDAVVVAAGAEKLIGPFPTSQYTDPATGLVTVTYDAVTSVTVAAVRGG